MPLSPEDKAEIADLIKESLTTTTENFTSQLNETSNLLKQEFTNQIGGVMGRTKKEIANAVSSVKDDFNNELKGTLDNLFEEQNNNSNLPPGDNDNNDKTSQLSQLANQIKNQANQMQQLQQRYQEAEQARIESEKQAARSRLESEFISKVGDRVVDPNNFMKVLLANNKIYEKDGQLITETGEMNVDGTPKTIAATEAVDTFLNNGYNYFAKPRPGNGGGSDSGNDQPQNYQSKYFNNGSSASADDLFAAMKQGKTDEVMQDLKNAVQ